MSDVVAALDCGSNSTRLLIADQDHETIRRETRITRLSQGVDASGTLLPEALQRSYDVLSEYRSMMDDAGVERGLLVATSAVRDARNGEEFLERARELTGVEVYESSAVTRRPRSPTSVPLRDSRRMNVSRRSLTSAVDRPRWRPRSAASSGATPCSWGVCE